MSVPFVRATYFQLTILHFSFPPMSSESFSIVMSVAKIFSRAFWKENVGGCSAKTMSGSSPASTKENHGVSISSLDPGVNETLTSGIHGGVFSIGERFWLLVEIVKVGFEVDVRAIASGCRVQLADLGLVHHLYVRQVLQGW